jgi:hypothetical protein
MALAKMMRRVVENVRLVHKNLLMVDKKDPSENVKSYYKIVQADVLINVIGIISTHNKKKKVLIIIL